MVGLDKVDNTSDLDKPVSKATSDQLALKAPVASPTFTGTVSGITKAMVGLGNVDNTRDLDKPTSNATKTYVDPQLATKADKNNTTLTGTANVNALSVSGKMVIQNNQIGTDNNNTLFLTQNVPDGFSSLYLTNPSNNSQIYVDSNSLLSRSNTANKTMKTTPNSTDGVTVNYDGSVACNKTATLIGDVTFGGKLLTFLQ